jgi:hypothetical protein
LGEGVNVYFCSRVANAMIASISAKCLPMQLAESADEVSALK